MSPIKLLKKLITINLLKYVREKFKSHQGNSGYIPTGFL